MTELRFEWSPGRRDRRYLNNRTAFDAILTHTTPDGGHGFIGIETKYHERPARPERLSPERLELYAQVTERSRAFPADWREVLAQTSLQQSWLDHLLAFSMLHEWDTGLFVLVYPAANTSMASVADHYATMLLDAATFEHRTLEEMVERLRVITKSPWVAAFEDRYLNFWEATGGWGQPGVIPERLRASKDRPTAVPTSVSAGQSGLSGAK